MVVSKLQAFLLNRFTWLYVLMLFPIIDYLLRNVMPLPVISTLWDEAVLALLLAVAIFRRWETNRKLPSLKHPLIAFIVLGLALIVFDMRYFAIDFEGFRATYQYILAFFIGYYLLQRETEALTLIRLFLVVAGIVGLYGVYQYVVGVEVPQGWTDASENLRTRAFSIVQSPNVLGSFMALAAPIAFGMALVDRGWRRMLWIGIGLILLAALVFTASRGAWLAFAAAIGLAIMLINRKVFIVFLVVAVLSAAFVPQINSRFVSLFNQQYLEKSSENGRIGRWTGAYDQMRNNPVFGLGPGHYGGAVADRHFGTIYVDSYYFKTLAETGILGLGMYAWLMLALLGDLRKTWLTRRRSRTFLLYGGIFAGLLAVILHNGVENIFEVPFMNTFFWVLAGITLSLPYLKPLSEGKDLALEGGEAHV